MPHPQALSALPDASTDAPTDALGLLRMSGVVYCRSEFTAPWGLRLPPMAGCLSFHLMASGQGWLHENRTGWHALGPGHVALVSHGQGHVLAGTQTAPVHELFDVPREPICSWYEVLRLGGGGEPATVICGAVRFDDPLSQRLVAALPPVLTLSAADSPDLEWMHHTFRFLAQEARHPRTGSETLITRLADVILLQTLRAWTDSDPAARTGWIGALRDRSIGQALRLMHEHPQQAWTLASLAQAVGLSRSAFAARFSDLVGLPPMDYLTRWRVQVATGLLRNPAGGLARVAEAVGYGSEAAFSRAFKRITGHTPGSVPAGMPPDVGWLGGPEQGPVHMHRSSRHDGRRCEGDSGRLLRPSPSGHPRSA